MSTTMMKPKFVNFIAIVLLLSFGVHLFSIATTKVDTSRYDIYEGYFFSADGTQLSSTKDDKKIAYLNYSEAYSPLIGSASTSSVTGLRAKYREYLWAGKKSGSHGCNIYLTIDHSLQEDVYSIINSLNADSAAVVMENKTGKVLALVSTKSDYVYDGNISFRNEDDQELNDGDLIPTWSMSTAPGSTFKIISAIPVIEAGKDQEVYYDSGSVQAKGGTKVSNYNGYSYGNITLKEALRKSSNCYFVNQYSTNLGKSELNDIADRFQIVETLETDFGTLTSNFDITGGSSELIGSCFGQGKTLVTPIHMAMYMAALRTGNLTKPYMIDKITRADGKKTYVKGKTEVISKNIIDKDVRDKLISYLEYAGEGYGLKGIAAKSGTAETADNEGSTVAWMAASTEEYTVCLRTDKQIMGGELGPYIQDIFDSIK